MGIVATIKAVIDAIRWLRREKKKMEADAKTYLSQDRALRSRLWLETMAKALEEGEANPNFKKLPKLVRWFCCGTQIDNYIGEFGQRVLKSQKLADGNPILRKDVEIWQGPK